MPSSVVQEIILLLSFAHSGRPQRIDQICISMSHGCLRHCSSCCADCKINRVICSFNVIRIILICFLCVVNWQQFDFFYLLWKPYMNTIRCVLMVWFGDLREGIKNNLSAERRELVFFESFFILHVTLCICNKVPKIMNFLNWLNSLDSYARVGGVKNILCTDIKMLASGFSIDGKNLFHCRWFWCWCDVNEN